jgi:lipoprotein-releasing system ATP-binding protein
MLTATNIKKVYASGEESLEVLKGIDLVINEGEELAIVGPSGAGKSTLLHILGGLDKPSDGSVKFEGEDIYKLNDQKRAYMRNERIGFIFQFYHLLPEFTALENVCMPMLIKQDAQSIKEFESYGLELLAAVGLRARALHKPNQLSGGEQQRVAIARALINRPRIVFCDEPTGNLDSANSEVIMDLLKKLNKEKKQTLVLVTHDEELARHMKRTLNLRDGKLLN